MKAPSLTTRLLLCALLFLAPLGQAQDIPRLAGTVTRIVDGDTIDVKLSSGPIRVRLNAIDTPEKGQPWDKEASAALARLIQGRQIEIEPFEQDRYERLIGRVYLNGADINGELVKQGHAWAFRRYMTRADARYCTFEQSARNAHLGLWSLKASGQMPPWEYRKHRKGDPPWRPAPLTEALCMAQIGKKIHKIGFLNTSEP